MGYTWGDEREEKQMRAAERLKWVFNMIQFNSSSTHCTSDARVDPQPVGQVGSGKLTRKHHRFEQVSQQATKLISK